MSTTADWELGSLDSSSPADDPVLPALAALRAGRPVLVLDDASRENEGDVILPAALADPRWTAWAVRHTSGYLCAPLPADRADALDLPLMVLHNADPHGTAYTVAVDAARGVSTGISASDRAHTARILADPDARPSDLTRPGHLLPLRARDGGVCERPGHTEAGVDLCRLAGLPPVALIAELVRPDGAMARPGDVRELGRSRDLPVLEIADIVAHRFVHGDGLRARVTRGASARLPTPHGVLDAVGYRDEVTGAEHLALTAGATGAGLPLVALHIECVAGDVLGSRSCPCAHRLDTALRMIATEGGTVIYLRRPCPTFPDLRTHDWTAGDSGAAAAILGDLGRAQVRLLPGPGSTADLAAAGISAHVAGLAPSPAGSPIPAAAGPFPPVLG